MSASRVDNEYKGLSSRSPARTAILVTNHLEGVYQAGSSRYSNEQPVPLWGYHRDLRRFHGKLGSEYQLAVQTLQETTAEIMADMGQQTTSLSITR